MPFDHARCPSCQAVLDPERLRAGTKGPECPHCKTTLSLVDLFGVSDAFRDEESPNLTLDDLVPQKQSSGRPSAPEALSLDSLVPLPRRRDE